VTHARIQVGTVLLDVRRKGNGLELIFHDGAKRLSEIIEIDQVEYSGLCEPGHVLMRGSVEIAHDVFGNLNIFGVAEDEQSCRFSELEQAVAKLSGGA